MKPWSVFSCIVFTTVLFSKRVSGLHWAPHTHATFYGNNARQVAYRWRPLVHFECEEWIACTSDALNARTQQHMLPFLTNYTRALTAFERGAFAVLCSDDETDLAALYVIEVLFDAQPTLQTILWDPCIIKDSQRSLALRELRQWYRLTFRTDLKT